jgi:type IV pilus assembly protein PilY1
VSTNHHAYRISRRSALSATALALLLANSLPGNAATDLSDIPLTAATSVTVLPNIFFIFDNSGSMQWNYLPDYVTDSYCKNNTSLQSCEEGDPPWYTNAFNGVAYDPTITYSPPLDAAGNVKRGWSGGNTWLASNTTTWNAVPIDGYKILSSSTINLTTGYPERVWCNSTNATTCNNPANYKSAIDTSTTPATYAYPDGTYRYLKTIYAAPVYYTATVQWCTGNGGSPWGTGTCSDRQTSTYKYVKYSNWQVVRIVPTTTAYAKAVTRTDCLGATCTYNEEMANFANWYAWYRTRQQMMKTAMSLVFSDVRGTPNAVDPLDKNYFHARVGFTTISDFSTTPSTSFLPIANFDGNTVGTTTQKGKFFDSLFKADGSSSTPLRPALTKAGRLYAGKLIDANNPDPLQYSCQRNYTILSTDGYWNMGSEPGNPGYKPKKVDGSSQIGNMDGAAACNTSTSDVAKCNDSGVCDAIPTRPECDSVGASNSLADIAYYYYHTDLRPADVSGNCLRPFCENNVPASGSNKTTDDVATWQHMTTFTVGLGVNGVLSYQDGYKTALTGDYASIKAGTLAWPDPQTSSTSSTVTERIDDLWHAAVNGRGTYFRADSPRSLADGLRKALSEMGANNGAGAAAAASNLQLEPGDSFAYIGSYRTVNWDGDVKAYTLDPATAAMGAAVVWQAQPMLNARITGTCGNGDSRTIYTGSTTIKTFTWANLSTTERTYFDTSKLDQWAGWSALDRAAATGDTLVNYLRGQNLYEDQDRDAAFITACPAYRRLYRDRENVLGDIIHSQPVYMKQPKFNFADAGYDAFKATARDARLYVAANDGMLHAFDAGTGAEQWAYIPPLALKNLYKLAGEFYSTSHQYFLDGPINVADVNAGGWKTILVGALGKGGRGIYALDVTGTGAGYPKVLWNFSAEGPDGIANTADDNPNLGYTYGQPIVTKMKDGTWVVVIASGYNNIPNLPNAGNFPTADGVGRVFVIRASDGFLLKTISTGVGSVANPSGLANLRGHVLDLATDNTVERVYGGDLFGNLWGFDLDAGTAYKIASVGQAIAVAPAISEIDGNTVLFFGTGRYLGQTDLTNIPTETIYGIKDNNGGAVITRSNLVQQVMSAARKLTVNSVDWNTKSGWYVDLPTGEMVNLPAQLYGPVLIVASVAPTSSACEAGGHGYRYGLNVRTGSASDNNATTTAGTYYPSPLVGITVLQTTTGQGKELDNTNNGPNISDTPPEPGLGKGKGARVIWHEMID